MRRSFVISTGLLLALLAFARTSSADPISVAGTVFLTNFGPSFQSQPSIKLILWGPHGIRITAGWDEGESWVRYPGGITVTRQPTAGAGQPYDLSTRVTFAAGSGFTDQTIGYVPIDADLTFDAGTAILQAIEDNTPVHTDLIALAPARFFGVIRGFDPDTHNLLFEDQIRSRPGGSSRVLLSSTDPAVYDFVYGASTPEPGSVLLFGTGLGLLGVAARRRRADAA